MLKRLLKIKGNKSTLARLSKEKDLKIFNFVIFPPSRKDCLRGEKEKKNEQNNKNTKKKNLLILRAVCRGGPCWVHQTIWRFDKESTSDAHLSFPPEPPVSFIRIPTKVPEVVQIQTRH